MPPVFGDSAEADAPRSPAHLHRFLPSARFPSRFSLLLSSLHLSSMPAESYGVKLSLQALVKAWVDHHPGGEHEHDHAERWLQSMMRLVDRYTATFRSSDWEELEDEVERYHEDLSREGFATSCVSAFLSLVLLRTLSTRLTPGPSYAVRQDRRGEYAARPADPKHARRRRRRRGARRRRSLSRTGAGSSLSLFLLAAH